MADIAEKARKLAEPFAKELGLEFWDVCFLKEGAEWYLRYFIDKPGGVNIDDCEALSRAVDAPLDEENFIDRSYCLEVSSPGLGRKLSKPEHFEKMKGQEVTVHLIKAQNNTRDIIGVLEGLDGHDIVLKTLEDEEIRIAKQDASFVKLNDDIF